MKKKAYWQKLNELQVMKKQMRETYITENVNLSKTFEDSAEHFAHDKTFDVAGKDTSEDEDSQNIIELDEYETDKETGYPKVKLYYPNDYEDVKNLPSHKLRRSRKKRVKGLVQRVLVCLSTTLVALATPVVAELGEAVAEPARDFCRALLGPNTVQGKPEEIALLELFAGSAKLTAEFAHQGHNVLEPRDILLGHDLFDPLQQESVFNDIIQETSTSLGGIAVYEMVPVAEVELRSAASTTSPRTTETTKVGALRSGVCLEPDSKGWGSHV